jgi:putative endonuclease
MYHVYILKSEKDGKLYIGQTSNLEERLSAHNRGSVKSTKHRRPLKLIYSKEFHDHGWISNYLKKLKKPISIFKHISLLENSGFVL